MILVPDARIKEYTSRGWWGEQTLGDLFLDCIGRHPDRLAVADPPNLFALAGVEPRALSWAELGHEVLGIVAVLKARGIRRDDVIVMQWPNCVRQHAVYLACALTGVIVTPVPVQYRAHELAQIVARTGARLALVATRVGHFALAAHWVEHRASLPTIESVLTLGDAPPIGAEPLLGYEPPEFDAVALRAALAAIARESGVSAHDVLTVCWTSGTESAPKGVPRNHNEWLLVGRSVIDAGQIAEGAVMLVPFPFVNMAGISTSLMAWLMSGATVHHHHPFNLEVFIDQLRTHPTDYSIAAPAVLSLLLKEPDRLDGVDLSRLRRIGSGGAPLPEWLVEAFATRFEIEVVNYFGSNEGAALSAAPQDVPDRRHRARFFPRVGVPGYEWSLSNSNKISTRLVDPDSGDVIIEAGRVGELRFKGPTIFSAYFRAPDLTAAAFDQDGYYCTGDLFEIAGAGLEYYRFVGRKKDIVIRGGMNISTEEVEGLLSGHPKVREAAVIGVPDDALGERVCAVVVARGDDPPHLSELVRFLREEQSVAAYKCPEKLVLVDELPRNPLGKVLKRNLRERIGGAGSADSLQR